MPNKVAINGLGRIGRAALKLAVEHPELDVVAVNEIGSLDNMVYLLRYDTAYGRYERQVEAVEGKLVIDGKPLVYLSERDPGQLPWGDLGVDLVLECTGRFTEREDAEKHVRAGARWVVLSGPTKSPDVPTIIHGVNRPDGQTQIISCASCTTNNITPLVEILDRHFGVEKALLTTVHAYTATQALVDSPGGAKDLRRGRAAAQSFVPSSTGAATATAKALPAMQGRFDGVSVRGPVVVGSISDVVFVLARETTADEVNNVLRQEASSDRYKGILDVADDPLVSADIVKDPHATIVQLDMTRVVGGNLVKVMSWYDNEWGFTSQMIQVALQQLGLPAAARV
ncbi:MAG TPA: glyceraldehyde 3-phosphate dehydrogenase NAD-binding domain-containing protein [Actinomycetota bacterium]|nr:glyceraldehyde 3-phosphate dehydrogenase NAD-binding domain-containing protein [Actinomycetota bacterium]